MNTETEIKTCDSFINVPKKYLKHVELKNKMYEKYIDDKITIIKTKMDEQNKTQITKEILCDDPYIERTTTKINNKIISIIDKRLTKNNNYDITGHYF